ALVQYHPSSCVSIPIQQHPRRNPQLHHHLTFHPDSPGPRLAEQTRKHRSGDLFD
ncbi:hypothetical protein SDJN02_08127, partial [Cucurbita argyrosperma subsp. argyrosperma]